MAFHTAHAALIINPRKNAYRTRHHHADATLEVDLELETGKRKDHYATASMVVFPREVFNPQPMTRVR